MAEFTERDALRYAETLRAGRAVLHLRLAHYHGQLSPEDRAWAQAFERDVLRGEDPARSRAPEVASERARYLELVGASGWCEFDDVPAWADDASEHNGGVRRCPVCKTRDDLHYADAHPRGAE